MKEYVYIPRDINTRFPKVWESKDSLLIWLFIGLLFNADDKGAATISPAAFAQRVRCSERRMREALKTIEDAGYIAITGDNGGKTTISIINYSKKLCAMQGRRRWVKIYTTLMDWRWAHKPEYMSFLMWCLMMASPKDTFTENIEIKRGSFLTSVRELTELVGVTNKNARTIIQNLCKCGCIAVKTANKGTIITICNYDSYQSNENKTGKRLANDWQTTGKRLANDWQTNNILESKEEKNKRKEENNIIPPLTPQGGESGNPTGEENHEGFSGKLDFRESENSTENEEGEGENILTLTPPTEEKKKSSAKRKKAEDFKWDEIKDWFNGLVSSAGCKLKKMREFTPQRKTAFRNAIRTFGREKVAEAIRKATTVPFLNGDNDTDWRAGFDFLVNVNKIPRILEGCYDHLRREQKKTIIHEHRNAGVFDAYNEIVKQLENGTDTDSKASGGYDDNAAILAAIGG